MGNIKINKPSLKDIKNIFSNIDNAILLICDVLYFNKNDIKKKKTEEIYQLIIDNWDYELFKKSIRKIAFTTKYSINNLNKNIFIYNESIKKLYKEHGGDLSWGFAPNTYDSKLTSIVRSCKDFELGENELKIKVTKDFLMKRYISSRSFLYEYFLVIENHNIIPSLGNNKNLDFYIDGPDYDLKNTSSPTKKFKEDFGEKWKEVANENVDLVIRYLYEYQGEERFDNSNRLYFLDFSNNFKTVDEIKGVCKSFIKPKIYDIIYPYTNKLETKSYKTQAMGVII